jgi:hypothetical protein
VQGSDSALEHGNFGTISDTRIRTGALRHSSPRTRGSISDAFSVREFGGTTFEKRERYICQEY